MVAPLFKKSNTKQESVPTNVGTSSLVLLETVLWTTEQIKGRELHFVNTLIEPNHTARIACASQGSQMSKQNDKAYTTEDIGKEVTLNIDGVALNDVVVEVALPGRGSIIGPTFVCAHIFARLTMMEAMMAASAHANQERDDWSDEMA